MTSLNLIWIIVPVIGVLLRAVLASRRRPARRAASPAVAAGRQPRRPVMTPICYPGPLSWSSGRSSVLSPCSSASSR